MPSSRQTMLSCEHFRIQSESELISDASDCIITLLFYFNAFERSSMSSSSYGPLAISSICTCHE
jgi:hypothetical protein